jgi:hypothetical protein
MSKLESGPSVGRREKAVRDVNDAIAVSVANGTVVKRDCHTHSVGEHVPRIIVQERIRNPLNPGQGLSQAAGQLSIQEGNAPTGDVMHCGDNLELIVSHQVTKNGAVLLKPLGRQLCICGRDLLHEVLVLRAVLTWCIPVGRNSWLDTAAASG